MDNCRILQQIFFNAVKFELMSHLNSIISIQGREIAKLLATSVDEKGTSPMLTAIQHENCDVVIFLIENFGVDVNLSGTFDWDGMKYSNISPMCAALISRQMSIVNEFIMAEPGQLDKVTADVEEIKSSSISREEQIEALELMGAAYVFYNSDSSTYAISIWKEAMNLRNSTVDGGPLIAKTIFTHSSDQFSKAMGFALEFATMEELLQLESHLDFDNGDPEFNLYTQALLVLQRILDQSDPELKEYIFSVLYEYADMYHNNGRYNRAISIGMFMIEQFDGLVEWQDGSLNSTIIKTIGTVVASFVELMELPIPDRQELTFSNMMTIMDFTFEHNIQLRTVNDTDDDGDELDLLIFDQIDIMTEILPNVSEEENHRFKQHLYNFIRQDYRFVRVDQGNLLHIACCSCTISSQQFPVRVMKLLLDLGIDPNSTTSSGLTALHVLAGVQWNRWSTNITDAIQLLLDYGTHIDQPNVDGKTALEFFKVKEKELIDNGISNDYLKTLINKVLPLKCLAAQVVRQHEILFEAELLSSLLPFFNCH